MEESPYSADSDGENDELSLKKCSVLGHPLINSNHLIWSDPHSYPHINPRTGRPYTIKPVNNIWNEACKDAGIQIQLKNGTRHSVASQAATAGVPIQAIQGVLGHTDIRTTMENYACTDLTAQMVVFAALGSANDNPKKYNASKGRI